MKLLSLALLCLPIACAACTFPAIDIGSGGHAASTSAASTGKSSSDGSTASSGSNVTVSTGAETASSSVTSTSTGGNQCGACLMSTKCDCDGDGVERYDPTHNCTAVTAANQDCQDCDATVFPGQTEYFGVGGSNNFDYNCSNTKDPKYAEGTCASRTGLSANGGCAVSFLEFSGACGTTVAVDACVQGLTVANACQVEQTTMIPLPCH
jgi:hypothetical protein